MPFRFNPFTDRLDVVDTNSGAGPVVGLTGNVGGEVFPDGGGNINIVGSGTVTVTGNPGTNTLTITDSGAGVASVTGTANQVTAAPTTGAVILTTPVTFIAPGSIEATTTVKADTNFILATTSSTAGQITQGGNSVFNTYGTSNTFVGQSTGNFTLTTVSAVQNTGCGTQNLTALTTGFANATYGYQAGQAINSGRDNDLFGWGTGAKITSGGFNSGFGSGALFNLITGSQNSGFGYNSLNSCTGSSNTALGYGSAFFLGAGTNNFIAGAINAGSAYTTTESSNICIGNAGVIGESNVLRLGTTGAGVGQQSTCFIAGIQGVTPSGTLQYVTINSSGQLGSVSQTIAPSYIQKAFANSPYTVAATDYYISLDTVGGAISILLPNAPTTSRTFVIKDRTGHAAANNVSVTTVGGAVTIDGSTTYTMGSNFQAIQLIFNGTSYEVF